MSQAGPKLRRGEGQYFHWCPGCELAHPLPDSWQFDGNLEQPTFRPSFVQHLGDGGVCHYNLIDGQLSFTSDTWHALRNQTVPLPDLPAHLADA